MQKDPRRERSINVRQERVGLYRLEIDSQLWASVEWSPRNSRWCIEDSRDMCLARFLWSSPGRVSTGPLFCGRVGRRRGRSLKRQRFRRMVSATATVVVTAN